MANDGTVDISAGSGVAVDVTEITRNDGTVVERQRVVLGDDDGNLFNLDSSTLSASDSGTQDALADIASELRQIKYILSAWTGIDPLGD